MDKLSTYEVAWLVGGGRRVALVAFVILAGDGRLEVAYKRQRVKLPEGTAAADAPDPVEAAALALLPESGLAVHEFIDRLAATSTVASLDAAVRAKGQPRLRALRRFNPTYRELLAHPGTGRRRIAVLGVPAIEDDRLRDIFENPRPDMPKIDPVVPIRDNTVDGSIGPSEGTWTAGQP
jgi:hypothetical protein